MYITHGKTIHFLGMTKSKEAQIPAELAQLIYKSKHLRLTWAVQSNFSTTWQLEPITISSSLSNQNQKRDTCPAGVKPFLAKLNFIISHMT